MKQLFTSALIIAMAFACNNPGGASTNSPDSTQPEMTPPVNRQGNTSMDTSTLLPSDTASVIDSGAPAHKLTTDTSHH